MRHLRRRGKTERLSAFYSSVAIPILSLTLITWTSFATACYAATEGQAFDRVIGRSSDTLAEFVGGVISRCEGLNYVTEQDSEVFAFYRNAPVRELTEAGFLKLLKHPAETVIVRRSWADFIRARVRTDPTGRWRQLQEYLEANLNDLVVFQIPRGEPYEAQYDLYAVGVFKGRTVVGVQTFGVAT